MSTEANGGEDERQLIEQRFVENLRRVREDAEVSQSELARRMADRGWPYHQQTVARLESGARSVRLGEAKALASVLGTSLDRLTQRTEVAWTAENLHRLCERVEQASTGIIASTKRLLDAQAVLVEVAARAQRMQGAHDLFGGLLDIAREVRDRTPEQAVETGRVEYEQDQEAQAYVEEMQAEREGAGNGERQETA